MEEIIWNPKSSEKCGYQVIDWISGYMSQVEDYPVLSKVKPGDIRDRLSEDPPVVGEAMESVLADFKNIILPGITHWNHP
jgi:aromatic-L-amino-acid/L-tryptophan decarboxylase